MDKHGWETTRLCVQHIAKEVWSILFNPVEQGNIMLCKIYYEREVTSLFVWHDMDWSKEKALTKGIFIKRMRDAIVSVPLSSWKYFVSMIWLLTIQVVPEVTVQCVSDLLLYLNSGTFESALKCVAGWRSSFTVRAIKSAITYQEIH